MPAELAVMCGVGVRELGGADADLSTGIRLRNSSFRFPKQIFHFRDVALPLLSQ
jgi:hypothetical protein